MENKIQQDQLALRVGTTLQNGARIIALRWYLVSETMWRGFVLALSDGFQPFVVWDRAVDTGFTASGAPMQVDVTYHGHYFGNLEDAMEDYKDRIEQKTHEQQNVKAIRQRAAQDGENAAEWWLDSISDMDAVRRIITGIEDGDPAIMDHLPRADFSGEMAGGETWEDILVEAEVIEDRDDMPDDLFDDLYNEYCEAYIDAANSLIEAKLSEQVRKTIPMEVTVVSTGVPNSDKMLVCDRLGQLYLAEPFYTHSDPDSEQVSPGDTIFLLPDDLESQDGSEVHRLLN